MGDYLAIMTLFFAQIFVELVRNFERLPFVSDDLNLTGGPNGIPGVKPWDLFGFEINTVTRHYYLAKWSYGDPERNRRCRAFDMFHRQGNAKRLIAGLATTSGSHFATLLKSKQPRGLPAAASE